MIPEASPATALVVDDTAFNRKKLKAALSAIGVDAILAHDAQTGLDLMREVAFDLVLLDIVMPDKDGFDVLREVRDDTRLRDVPVLIVSAIDRADDIALALELGAVDFLPKIVAPQVFRARVWGAIEKKRLRDHELSFIQDVAQLTFAANLVRGGRSDPETLDLAQVMQRADGLGNLAQVFCELVTSVHKRELAARTRINLLQGSLLLVIMGLSWGAVPALSKILVGPTDLNRLAIAPWVAIVTLAAASGLLAAQDLRPVVTRAKIRFGLIAGLFAGALPQVGMFWVSDHVPGVVISITLALETLLVFSIAAALRIERPSATRLGGLLFGLLAVLLVMFGSEQSDDLGPSLWALAALIVPLSYAVEGILVASLPEDQTTSPLELLFFIMAGSAFWGWTGAVLSGSFLNPLTAEPSTIVRIGTIGLLSAISNGCYVFTIRKMGAVFASQYVYFATLLGVGWSILLLGERLTLWVCAALACVIFGLFIVRPKDNRHQGADMMPPARPTDRQGPGRGTIPPRSALAEALDR